jgi:hypothetical protein
VPGDPGVVEDQHTAGADAGGGGRGVAGELAGRDAGQAAVRVVQQRDAGRPEFGGCLAQLGSAGLVQISLRLIERGRPAVGVAQDVHGSASRRELVDHRAQPEALVVRVRDHH